MPYTPAYRTYLLQCPANAGKIEAIENWVKQWRELAHLERDYQVARFYRTKGKQGLEMSATKGWGRPWVQDGRCSTTMAQQIMAQVCAQLKGHLGLLKNTVQVLISEQAKEHAWDANEKHRLYSLNRHGLWLANKDVKSPIKDETSTPKSTLMRCRKLLFQALRQHSLPRFDAYHPQLDQRNCRVDFARTPKSNFTLWARVSPTACGQAIELPLVGWKGLLETIETTSAALATGQAQRRDVMRLRQAEKRKGSGKPPVDPDKQRAPFDARRAALPHTLRLMLNQSESSSILQVAVVLDHSAHDALLRADYTPTPGKTIALDLGLNVLLATSEGDLLGRNWTEKLERYAKIIDSIAVHRQRLGLPVRSARYDAWVAKLDGFMKTQIHTMLNRFVARTQPERIIVSDDSWHLTPNLSRRLNRLASRFGKRHLNAALQKLEATHGIVIETRPGAYTSKECHRCGYVDSRNRATRSEFICKCCNKKVHADVNAARVSKDRRSAPAMDTFWPHPKHTLREVITRFTARNPRPEALEHRPVGRANDPRWSNPYFQVWQHYWTPRVEVTEASIRWRKPRPGASLGVSLSGQGCPEGRVTVGKPTRNANRANNRRRL